MTRNRPECAVPDCFAPGSHLTGCEDYTKCDGCAPGLAVDQLATCKHHRVQPVRDLERLPLLFAQLGDRLNVYRSPQAPKGDGGRSSEAPDVIDADVFRIRQIILERLAVIASYVIVELRLQQRPGGDVSALVEFLTGRADWLCTHEPALRPHYWGDRVAELVSEARRIVNRPRVVGIYLGACPIAIADDGETRPCGGAIRYEPTGDPTWQVECPWCHKRDTLEWWRKQIAGDAADEPLLPGAQLATRLSVKLSVPITDSLLRKWKRAERVDAVAWCQLVGDQRPRVLYVAESVEAHARKVYGLPDLEDRAAS